MIYWSKIVSLIVFTFITLNLFYIYNFNLYSDVIHKTIYNFYKSSHGVFNDNNCNEQPLLICKSTQFPDIIIQINIAILGAELMNFVTLIFRFVIFYTKDLSNNYYKEHKSLLKFHHDVYQILVHFFFYHRI